MSEGQKNIRNLTKSELETFKASLLAKRNELLGNVSYMEKDALKEERSELSNMPIHMADVGTDSYEKEFTLELMDSERKLISEIDEALGRIENGTYGICQLNGEPIPKSRLTAIPWTRYCVPCASLIEKKHAKEEGYTDKYTYSNDTGDDDDSDSENTGKTS